jgi:hypothetical protein
MLVNNKQKTKENLISEKRKTNDERLRELEQQHYMNQEEKYVKEQRQKIYRSLLDDQSQILIHNQNQSLGSHGGQSPSQGHQYNGIMRNSSMGAIPIPIQVNNSGKNNGNMINNSYNEYQQLPVKSQSPILNRKRDFDPNPCKIILNFIR